MGNAVLPTLPGQAWGYVRKPVFNTKIQPSVSGNELRGKFQQYPTYTFDLPIEVIRDSASLPELKALFGFFLSRNGSFDSFLYTDPDDCAVIDMPFGLGDGVTKDFQLTRAYGANGNTFAEPVQNVNAITAIKDAGTVTAAYTINSTGKVSFTTAPAVGHVLTWTGTFYYRCRFLYDEADFTKMSQGLWELKKLSFKGSPKNKV